jgi:hypothetical protein
MTYATTVYGEFYNNQIKELTMSEKYAYKNYEVTLKSYICLNQRVFQITLLEY